MITSLLIGNRGEIARRIIQTARRLRIRAIAVYSEADAGALHVRDADQAVEIGPAPAAQSYLDGGRIIAAAKAAGAEAIHPGYGFLAENAGFAEAVLAAGLVWVGPPPAAIRAMGLKDAAKRLMQRAGVPVTPGYMGENQDEAALARAAAAVGFPIMIKAVAGGGGKGMRKVETKEDFAAALASARREARAAFGDDKVLLEKAIEQPRHIEVQVFGDTQGALVHLFERDCSLQRRHQKVIEEAPAPGMTPAVRALICDAALKAAQVVGYVGAGTVEFIADASEGLRPDRIWFMEMNTRLQVEHPVTEAITGLDLVEWQLRVASGEPLPLTQGQIAINGHAMEARLYAEDPANGFLPSTGKLDYFHLPWSVRRDNAVDHGDAVTPYYDPMIAKLIAHGESRQAAIVDLTQACADVQVWPVKTNAGFLTRLLKDADFRAGDVDTGLIARRAESLTAKPAPSSDVLAVAAWMRLKIAAPLAERASPWIQASGFRLNAPPKIEVRLQYGSETLSIPGDPPAHDVLGAVYLDGRVIVFEAGETYEFSDPSAVMGAMAIGGDGAVRAPMPGKIAAVHVAAGDKVARGEALVTLEAMKMEHALTAPFDGVATEVAAVLGEQVSEGVLLARVEAEP
ncbi:MAG TPA: biotin carboxylase N-terminal domain-containing protein [Caulobacteraceae bacterium]|nr:biotin carboxylase N-terminal domain-containing protein [Caulobacteraceae bacterium]